MIRHMEHFLFGELLGSAAALFLGAVALRALFGDKKKPETEQTKH